MDGDELAKIVIHLASKDELAYDYILLNYLDPENGKEELFEEAKRDIDEYFDHNYRGRALQTKVANMLTDCNRRIKTFAAVSKDKAMEADLMIYVLDDIFLLGEVEFGTCWAKFDHKVAMMVKRLITIVEKKLHDDLKIEYRESINGYLRILKKEAYFVPAVGKLPESI
jgi:hypothetical protein